MHRRVAIVLIMAACLFVAAVPNPSLAVEEKLPSKSDASCLKCHEYDKMPGLFAGKLADVSIKVKNNPMQIDKDMENRIL